MEADLFDCVEHWVFDPKSGDTCTTVLKGTGEVLNRKRWQFGQSPMFLTSVWPPRHPTDDSIILAERHFSIERQEIGRLKGDA